MVEVAAGPSDSFSHEKVSLFLFLFASLGVFQIKHALRCIT